MITGIIIGFYVGTAISIFICLHGPRAENWFSKNEHIDDLPFKLVVSVLWGSFLFIAGSVLLKEMVGRKLEIYLQRRNRARGIEL